MRCVERQPPAVREDRAWEDVRVDARLPRVHRYRNDLPLVPSRLQHGAYQGGEHRAIALRPLHLEQSFRGDQQLQLVALAEPSF